MDAAGALRRAGLEIEALIDTAAELAAVRRKLVGAGYFHASTHGMYDPLAPERSALQLAHGEALRACDLDGEELGALRLVYLSACDPHSRAYVRRTNSSA